MEYTGICILTLVIICIIGQNKVSGLRCYKCSSLLNPDCGNTLELSGKDIEKYVVDCPSSTKACQKIVGEIQGSGDQHIYRQCWEGSDMQDYTPTGCVDDEIRGGTFCRCITDACNGQRNLAATISVLILALLCHNL